MSESANKHTILVVDDEGTIREFMQVMLVEAGYQVELATSGEEALEKLAVSLPDLVILDVNMSGLTGFEVCQRIKSNPATAVLPVIIATALDERKDRLEGISAGAIDFLHKPVDVEDLLIRVRNALKSKSFYDEVRQRYTRLQDLEILRDHLIHFIVHDIRTPLQSILAYLELIEESVREPETQEFLRLAQQNSKVISRLLEDLLSVYQMESHQLRLHSSASSLGELWADVLGILEGLARQRRVQLLCELRPGDFPVMVDRDLIRRVLLNLLSNALKYSPTHGEVEVIAQERMDSGQRWVDVSIHDQGPGIPEEHHRRIFERFGVVETASTGARRSVGLGLTFCKLAIEAHGGRIWVESQPGHGSTFCFTLPARI